MREAVYSKRLQCGSKTYFFDIRETKSCGKYLRVTESRLLEKGGRRRSDITVFNEYLKDFKKTLEEMIEKCQPKITQP